MDACHIEWITIPAPDLDAAMSFYTHVFGFAVTEYSERFWVFKAGNLSGGLDRDLIAGTQGIGFSVTVSDIQQTIKFIVEHGGTILKQPYELGPGAGYCAQFTDPNGNVLELYCESLD